VPELIEYQDAAYARQYVEFVTRVAGEESRKTPGRTGLSEAVARHLFKLMAYKDEYEVARLHLSAALEAELHARFGPEIRYYWHLHPPLLRALGLKKKIRFGSWFKPVFSALHAMKGLRGTPFDVFGWSEERRTERRLIEEYEATVAELLERLNRDNHKLAVEIAGIPEHIRGYGHVKRRHLDEAKKKEAGLLAAFRTQRSAARAA